MDHFSPILIIVTIITAFSAVLTQAVEQINAQSLNVTKQTTYITASNFPRVALA